MRKRSNKHNYFLFPAIGLVLFFISFELFNHVLTLKFSKYSFTIFEGNVVFADDPPKYYEETLKNSYDLDNTWIPGEQVGTSGEPLISGKSGLLVDITTGKTLYEKASTEKMEIASLTKIMTAVIALEHKHLTDKIWVTRPAAYVGENTMDLTTGETYTLEELLYGLVLNSGNDAAYAIAYGTAGDSETFVKWMNIKAKELGLNDTNFTDPSGLDEHNISTAADLAKLTRYALKNPDFKKVVGTLQIELNSDTHKYIYLENQTNLLRSYPGVAGVKTGYTEDAGLCLVTYANNGGHEVVGIVLNSLDRKGDMVLMLDHGFGTLGISVPHGAFY